MEPGYIKCKYCNDDNFILNNRIVKISFCKVCGGSGKIDWITNILGNTHNIKFNKWYHMGLIFDGNKMTYIQNGLLVNEEDYIVNVQLKKQDEKFDVTFNLNLKGYTDNLHGCIGGSV